MELKRTLEQLVALTRYAIRWSDALFGYVFEMAPDRKSHLRGCPLAGTISDEEELRSYFKPVGERVVELVARGEDQAVPLSAPDEIGSDAKSRFVVIVTQNLGTNACVAIAYRFYDRDEALRTLGLMELIMTTENLNSAS